MILLSGKILCRTFDRAHIIQVKADELDLARSRGGGGLDGLDGCFDFTLNTTGHVHLGTLAVQYLDKFEIDTGIPTSDHEDLGLEVRNILVGEGGTSWEELSPISRYHEIKAGVRGRGRGRVTMSEC